MCVCECVSVWGQLEILKGKRIEGVSYCFKVLALGLGALRVLTELMPYLVQFQAPHTPHLGTSLGATSLDAALHTPKHCWL